MTTISGHPDPMTPAEVAALLRVKQWFVTERCRSGEIRAYKVGQSWRISHADYLAWKEANANRPADEAVSA